MRFKVVLVVLIVLFILMVVACKNEDSEKNNIKQLKQLPNKNEEIDDTIHFRDIAFRIPDNYDQVEGSNDENELVFEDGEDNNQYIKVQYYDESYGNILKPKNAESFCDVISSENSEFNNNGYDIIDVTDTLSGIMIDLNKEEVDPLI
jgi:hypothetical protein